MIRRPPRSTLSLHDALPICSRPHGRREIVSAEFSRQQPPEVRSLDVYLRSGRKLRESDRTVWRELHKGWNPFAGLQNQSLLATAHKAKPRFLGPFPKGSAARPSPARTESF